MKAIKMFESNNFLLIILMNYIQNVNSLIIKYIFQDDSQNISKLFNKLNFISHKNKINIANFYDFLMN